MPLQPCSPARARKLLRSKRAVVHRHTPFVIQTVHRFKTGDFVRAVVPTGKKAGTHTGRVAVRTKGSFNITTRHGIVQGIHHRHVRLLQRADGYAYTTEKEAGASPGIASGKSAPRSA
ncbi:RRXRR domain-containing protein [Streptomyces dengpaensis]